MMTVAWVIGSGGLLGRALVTAVGARQDWVLSDSPSLSWTDESALESEVRSCARTLIERADRHDSDWTIIWAAGAAVTSSTAETLAVELRRLERVLAVIGECVSPSTRQGSFFYASSAGGVYGGSTQPPFSEATEPHPISPYGDFKLHAEEAVRRFARDNGISSVVGRIANLYGPGQKLDKMQGLISHIARAQFSPTATSIYVSLDTMRDYIFVADCAELVLDVLTRALSESRDDQPLAITKILASGTGVTIATLLGHFRTLVKGNPHVMLGMSANASLQAHDLRLSSRVWPELDRRQLTPLPAGIHATMMDILGGIQAGSSAG